MIPREELLFVPELYFIKQTQTCFLSNYIALFYHSHNLPGISRFGVSFLYIMLPSIMLVKFAKNNYDSQTWLVNANGFASKRYRYRILFIVTYFSKYGIVY